MSWRTWRVALAVNAAMGTIGKARAQAAELAIIRAELVSPLGDAVRFVDGKESDWEMRQPIEGALGGQAFRRKIEQTIFALCAPSPSRCFVQIDF